MADEEITEVTENNETPVTEDTNNENENPIEETPAEVTENNETPAAENTTQNAFNPANEYMEYKGYVFPRDPFNYSTLRGLQYCRIIDALENMRPNRILEFGTGKSTTIFSQYCKKYEKTAVSIIDNEDIRQENSVLFPLTNSTNLVVAERTFGPCTIYSGFEEWLNEQEAFDFILVDGPYGEGTEGDAYCRPQILDFPLLDKLADNSMIFYHDSNYETAKPVLSALDSILTEKGFSFVRRQDCPDTIYNSANIRQMTSYQITK